MGSSVTGGLPGGAVSWVCGSSHTSFAPSSIHFYGELDHMRVVEVLMIFIGFSHSWKHANKI